jgi:hypothetical protein
MLREGISLNPSEHAVKWIKRSLAANVADDVTPKEEAKQ